jgi:alpha-amylase/alpha-mannosidase (GH57 family)
MSVERYVCIHGHFYQPPRENPSLEAIELQDSAYPYHDWNERITAECYEPNAVSRILDGDRRIVKIVNNYAGMSFNIGPTLLAWLESQRPDLYAAILQADRASRERFSGHGSAIAQVYNHVILPLANRRDKVTQVEWGLADFEDRFGRKPEGMWLAETAVDVESLEILAELGVRFTILAPHQARRVRKKGARKWEDVEGGHIDPTTAYEAVLPSGGKIAIFFYDGPISRAIAFERLLTRGEHFASRLAGAFSDKRDWPQLVHTATDGETYGHHHHYGNMGLSYALEYLQANKLATLTNYGEYLEKHPPTHHVEIVENSAWSCAHGIDRWRSDCGCNSGGHPGWNQGWRGPLRDALDWLRDALARRCERQAAELFADFWAARDDYIRVVLDRSPENVARFLKKHARRTLSEAERISALKLLELQRQALLMYTSCGWFFDELSGIETVQVIQYAGRALQLAGELFDEPLEASFLEKLEKAKSNIPEHQDGRRIYEKFVVPAQVDLMKVAAHYAASSLFEDYADTTSVYCYEVEREDYRRLDVGRVRLAVGRAQITSRITSESARMSFACIHFGDHNLVAGVRAIQDDEAHNTMAQELSDAIGKTDILEAIRRLDRHFVASSYSLKTLFRDEQRHLLDTILESTLAGAEGVYRQLYQQHAPLTKFVAELGVPIPSAFKTAAQFILNLDIRRELERDEPDLSRVEALLAEAGRWQVQLDTAGLVYTLERIIAEQAARLKLRPRDLSVLQRLERLVDLARAVPFEVGLSRAQNTYYELLNDVYSRTNGEPPTGPDAAPRPDQIMALGEKLSIRVQE